MQENSKPRKKLSMATQILIAMVLSILVGYLLQNHQDIATNFIQPFGTVFLNLIKMIVVPVVLCSIMCGVISLNDIKKVGSIGGKTFLYYLMTTVVAISFGLGLATWLNVGSGFNMQADLASYQAQETSITDMVVDIFPSNIFSAFANANMLQVIIIALFFGFGALLAGEKGKPFIKLVDSLNEISLKIMDMIIKLSPIGVFGMLTPVVAVNGPEVLLPLIKFIAVVYLGFACHIIFTYSSTVFAIGKMNPLRFFKGVAPAMLFAYSSDSSVATLPLTIECCEGLGADSTIASFVLPLGATINIDGTALYEGITCIFVAQIFGITLSATQMITIIFMATIASIGTAGVPGGGIVMLAMIFEAVGLPLEGISLVLGVDRILDMGRTCVNVTGDASCAIVVNRLESRRNVAKDAVYVPPEEFEK